MKIQRYLGVLALSIFAACSHAAPTTITPPPDVGPIRITLLLFSGRPNPVFGVQAAFFATQIQPALTKASAMPASAAEMPAPKGLGYGGIQVENAGRIPDLPSELFVYHERIERGSPGKFDYLMDGSRTLEAVLLREALAQRIIDSNVLEAIERR